MNQQPSSSQFSDSSYQSSLADFASLIQKLQDPSTPPQIHLQLHQTLFKTYAHQLSSSSSSSFLFKVLSDPSVSFSVKFFCCHLLKDVVCKIRELVPDAVLNRFVELYVRNGAHSDSPSQQYPLVQNQISHILAIIAKKNIHFLPGISSGTNHQNGIDNQSSARPSVHESRQPSTAQHQFLLQLKSMIEYFLTNDGILGLKFINVLCAEFSSQKISKMGLTFREHEMSRVFFQEILLESIYVLTLNIIQTQMDSPQVLTQGFNILISILSWDFNASMDIFRKRSVKFEEREDDIFVPNFLSPNSGSWRKHVSDLRLIDMMMVVHEKHRTNSRLSHSIRQCLIRLSHISPVKVFKDMDPSVCIKFYSHIFQAFLKLCMNALELCKQNAMHATPEILDASSGIKQLLHTLPIKLIVSLPNMDQIIQQLATITEHVIRLGKVAPEADSEEAVDMLLLGWEGLVGNVREYFDQSAPVHTVLSTGLNAETIDRNTQRLKQLVLTNCAPQIVKVFVESSLAITKSQFETPDSLPLEESYDTPDRLQSICALARATIHFSVTLLHSCLSQRVEAFQTLASQSSTTKNVMSSVETRQLRSLHRDLMWLIRVCSFIIADAPDSEQSYIPEVIMSYTKQQEGISLIQLNQLIINLAEMENQCVTQKNWHLLQPKLTVAIIEYFDRFIRSYLMPDPSLYENITPAIIENYGHNESGKKLASFLLHKVLINLFHLQSSDEVATATCTFLSTMIELSYVQEYLVSTSTWKELLVQDRQTFSSLSLHSNFIKSKITELLCRACDALKQRGASTDEVTEYLSQVLIPIKDQLYTVLQTPNFTQSAYAEIVVRQQVEYCVSKCLGVARACELGIWRPMFQFFAQFQLFQTMRQLIEIYHQFSDLEAILFEFFSVLVEKVCIFLNNEQNAMLSREFLTAMSSYVQKTHGKTFDHNSSQENDHKRCLVYMMHTLTSMMGKDLFAEETTADQVSIPDVLFQGLTGLLPVISKDMLDFHDLRKEYFILVCNMLEMYPQNVAKLPPPIFGQILEYLEFGINHFESEIVRWSLSAVSSLAQYHLRNAQKNGGFLEQQSVRPDFSTKLLRSILNLMLFESVPRSAMDELSRSLMCLILWDETKYREVIQELIQQHPDRSLEQAFGKLQQG
eukprot:CAMPEP_0117437490 /NCGR_PEP_ID=MMETSP0759-20121206/1549_1 /TAXON_ID=63605 /ORGANISM="Percolomonas cosmopolitus, Strain WS" /LENGTH=1146 /DNA_ID=CAMNT_0005229121 /DNA_START=5 /DNA_END=3441 /DNA_ORIENTATION=-